jgi:GT2 family glycosyltransferase
MIQGYDLRQTFGQDLGARPSADGFEVSEPFGRFVLPEIDIPGGWYELVVTGTEARIRLELFEIENFKIIDLATTVGSPGYVKLVGGKYRPSVLPGARPGRYVMENAWLKPLSLLKKVGLLNGRLQDALRSRVSLKRLVGLIKLALSKGQTFGVRSSSQQQQELGVLTAADKHYRDTAENLQRRLGQVENGPLFFISGALETTLADQVYRRFTFEASSPYDYTVNIGEGEVLTPDALLLFAEFALKHPGKIVVLSDKWILEQPTCHVVWDPILYASGLPTPNCVRNGGEPLAKFENEDDFGIVPVPIAFTDTAENFETVGRNHFSEEIRPPCTIIIPTRDRSDLLEKCLEGLFGNTSWPHEVIVIDNGSVEAKTEKLFDDYRPFGLRVVRLDIPFNFSMLCNAGVRAATHPYIVLLNNDIVLKRSDWLSEMMAYATLPQVGAVGAKLLYPDGRLQHAGVMLGLTQLCGHLWRGLVATSQMHEPRIGTSSLRSAVTAACLCIEKTKFNLVGGLNEDQFAVTLNDVDLCLKLGEEGFVNVYAAQAVAYHHESESRGEDAANIAKTERRLAELRAFNAAWQDKIASDPFLPSACSRATESCLLR